MAEFKEICKARHSVRKFKEESIDDKLILYSIQDATIACTYAMLAAQSLGLSSVWVGAFDDEKVLEVLKSDKDRLPIGILPIGYSLQNPEITPRKPLDEIIRRI